MKRSLFVLVVAAALGLGLAAASAAQDSEPADALAPELGNTETAQAEAEPDKNSRLRCPDSTASRIKRADNRCTSPGRVYTAEDIQRTGETDIGSALQRLDPAISSRRF